MPIYRAQVILPYFTNLPEDVVVNQFHFFNASEDTEAVGEEIGILLDAFYTTVYGSSATNRVAYVDWPLVYAKVFNLDDPTPRIPYTTATFGFIAGTATTPIPTEVAVVMSFNAAPESGVRFQRLYNRIYFGAIASSWLTNSAADEFPRINAAQITVINDAAKQMQIDGELGGAKWRQYSDAGGIPVVRQIAGGWTDNSPDTQRRRSVLSTTRNVWTVDP